MTEITIENLYTYTSLMDAFNICLRAVRWKPSVQRFEQKCLERLYKDYRVIQSTGRLPDLNRRKPIYLYERGKRRQITPIAFNNRVLQRVICDKAILPVFEPSLISANGASRAGMGVKYTRDLCKRYLAEAFRLWGLNFYVATLDYSKFFDSIPHAECRKALERKFTDERIVDFCLEFISDGSDSDIGIALGSQVSQLMALIVPSAVDHDIKDRLGVRHYIRYMDDILIFAPTKAEIWKIVRAVESKSAEIGLRLNAKKTRIAPISRGFSFLKFRYRVTATGKIVMIPARAGTARNRRKLRKLAKKAQRGDMSRSDVDLSMQSWLAHNRAGNGHSANRTLLRTYYEAFGARYVEAE